MKKLNPLKYNIPLVCFAAALTGCSDIAPDDRYESLPAIEVTHRVLIEDFTGQTCNNCPKAHARIEALQELYGDAIVPVSIHAGFQSISIDNQTRVGLATPTGEEYNTVAGISAYGYPSIVVDYNFDNIYLGTSPTWENVVREALTMHPVVDITAEVSCTTAESGVSSIKIDTRLMSNVNIPDAKLQLWIVEDSIQALQTGVNDNPKPDYTYKHNNVFRASANGTWGQPIDLVANVIKESSTSYEVSTPWQQTWNLENVSVVAFIYTDADGVLQVVRKYLSKRDSE